MISGVKLADVSVNTMPASSRAYDSSSAEESPLLPPVKKRKIRAKTTVKKPKANLSKLVEMPIDVLYEVNFVLFF